MKTKDKRINKLGDISGIHASVLVAIRIAAKGDEVLAVKLIRHVSKAPVRSQQATYLRAMLETRPGMGLKKAHVLARLLLS